MNIQDSELESLAGSVQKTKKDLSQDVTPGGNDDSPRNNPVAGFFGGLGNLFGIGKPKEQETADT